MRKLKSCILGPQENRDKRQKPAATPQILRLHQGSKKEALTFQLQLL